MYAGSEELFNLIPHKNKYMLSEKEIIDYIKELQKENEKLNIILKGLANQKYEEKCKNAQIVHIDYVTKEKLQERIVKAIEYIENNDDEWFSTVELIGILEGEE